MIAVAQRLLLFSCCIAIACTNTSQGQSALEWPTQQTTDKQSEPYSPDPGKETPLKVEQADGTSAIPNDPPSPTVVNATPTTVPENTVQGSRDIASAKTEHNSGGVLKLLGDDPATLDPHLVADSGSFAIVTEIFGGLITMTPDLRLLPDLAERWDVDETGRKYTFALNDSARFHNGRQVTADDVKWSLERATSQTLGSGVAQQYLGDIEGAIDKLKGEITDIKGIKVLNAETLEISIDAPKSYFLAKMIHPAAFVLDRDNVGANGETWTKKPNGTGPFQLAKYLEREILVLKSNQHYHLGPPYLNQVEFLLQGGDSLTMYKNDEIHMTGVSLRALQEVEDPSSPFHKELHYARPPAMTSFLAINTNIAPLDDPNIRQAMSKAVDKQRLETVVYQGFARTANTIIPPGFPSHNPDMPAHEYDLELAKELLNKSSYGQQNYAIPAINLTIPGELGSPVPLDVEIIIEEWEALGLEIHVEQTPFETFLEDIQERRPQIFFSGWVGVFPDPQNFLDILFHSESDNNHTGYANAEVDRLLELARTEQDQESRYLIYNQVESIILGEFAVIPIYNPTEWPVLIKPNVQGMHFSPLLPPLLRYVYFKVD